MAHFPNNFYSQDNTSSDNIVSAKLIYSINKCDGNDLDIYFEI